MATLRSRSAFSLVELSIVLVILGLLVGGVLSGQSLIRAAELRSVSAQLSNYTSSANIFRDKYAALPGDMPNATKFWGAAASTSGSCITVASSSRATCDGNGDGLIQWGSLTGGESYRFWQHLANAQLVEGTFAGAPINGKEVAGENIPAGKISKSGWVTANGVDFTIYGLKTNFLLYASQISSGAFEGGVLKPEEAWTIDKKLDDGRVDSGIFVGANGNGQTGCITDAAQNFQIGATYDLASSSPTCRLAIGF